MYTDVAAIVILRIVIVYQNILLVFNHLFLAKTVQSERSGFLGQEVTKIQQFRL
jgi:hypothetical protein